MAPARPIHNLRCDDSFRVAAGKIIRTRFDEMMSFRDAALTGEDIEGIHDMRVASRRLRAALETFRDVFPSKRLRPLVREVKSLADALGQVRDTDVLIDRLRRDMKKRTFSEQLALTDIIAELEAQRDEKRDELKRVIDGIEREEFAHHFLFTVAQETK